MVTDDDYFLLSEWWKGHGWPPVRKELLSQFGLMVYKNEIPLAAGWLYLTTSKFGWLEFLVTNPLAPRKQTTIALKCLIERLIQEAKDFGVLSIFSSLNSKGLIKMYKKVGFKDLESNMTNMVFNI